MFGIDDAVNAVASIGGKLIDRLWPDPAQAAEAKLKLLEMQQTGELAKMTAETDLMKGQLAVDQTEAANTNVFVSGWRPFVGWVCGSAFAVHFIVLPLLNFAMMEMGRKEVVLTFDMQTLLTVLLGMLGLGGMRTLEKVKGVAAS